VTKLAAVIAGALVALAPGARVLEDGPRGDLPRVDPPRPVTERQDDLRPRAGYPRAKVEEALQRGFAFLASKESRLADGSWPVEDAASALRAPIAVAALSSLALMAGGNLPDRGPHGERVRRGIEYLLARAVREDGDPRIGFMGGDGVSRMHGHGFATLALAQAYAMSPDAPLGASLRETLVDAVALIERTQGAEGGWMYEPRLEAEHEGSVTVCLVSALRAARDAGILVDARVVDRAEDYVRRSQAEDGRFRYTLGSDKRTLALTAAGIATLEAAGSYDDPAVRRGLDVLLRELAAGTWEGQGEFPHYERYYVALALFGLPDREHFDRWFEDELLVLLASQQENGSWNDSNYGSVYATAINCLVLALPEGVLPIHQR
jgi:hypothetical protein